LAVTPTANAAIAQDAVAQVNDAAIPRDEWDRATRLDQVMSTLAQQPRPGAEATLERLINARLVLALADKAQPPLQPAPAADRLAALMQAWRVDATTLDQALQGAGLSRDDLLNEVKRLLVVEAYLARVSATQDVTAWLREQRRQARIGVYTDLAALSPAAANTATPAASAQATATAASAEQVALGVQLGQRAPDFSLQTLAGQSVNLSALRGQPVLLNFWASWCPPCRQEIPALQAAYLRYAPRGVALLGINIKEDAKTAEQFAASMAFTYPVALDSDGALSERYQVQGIPTTLVLDAQGIVRQRHVGPLTEQMIDDYLQPLLAAGPADAVVANNIEPTLTPAVASAAPDFALTSDKGATVRLADYRGKSQVVIVFYRGST
jgi:DsbE subfamily thiol:disulfide oxidoreductase